MPAQSGEEPLADLTIVSRSRQVPSIAPQAFLAAYDPPRVQWVSPEGLELVGADSAVHLTASGPNRFETLASKGSTLLADVDSDGPPATKPRLLGGFAFTADRTPSDPWRGFAEASFVLPAILLTSTGDTTWLTVTRAGHNVDPAVVEADLNSIRAELASLPAMQTSGTSPGVNQTHPTPDRERWQTIIDETIARITAGDLRKVVLARALEADLAGPFQAPAILERLRHRYPDCYRFLYQPTAAASFFGAPPERLVQLNGSTVKTEALAGSVPRGANPEQDVHYADQLRDSTKLQEEQGLVVDTIVEQLSPLGSISVGEQSIRQLSNIQHLHTPITATLDEDQHILQVVDALHPTPAVGGLPLEEALATIDATESFDRGWYAAPLGWFDAEGDGEFTVAIRSAVGANDSVTMFAGNGIVADSDPASEWIELQEKYRPILDELE